MQQYSYLIDILDTRLKFRLVEKTKVEKHEEVCYFIYFKGENLLQNSKIKKPFQNKIFIRSQNVDHCVVFHQHNVHVSYSKYSILG